MQMQKIKMQLYTHCIYSVCAINSTAWETKEAKITKLTKTIQSCWISVNYTNLILYCNGLLWSTGSWDSRSWGWTTLSTSKSDFDFDVDCEPCSGGPTYSKLHVKPNCKLHVTKQLKIATIH